jgi:hypothetical protein
MKSEKNKLFGQSDNQRSPGLARPRDFHIVESDDPNYHGKLPHHGQCGTTQKEYEELLAAGPKSRGEGNAVKGERNYDIRVQRELARENASKPQPGE